MIKTVIINMDYGIHEQVNLNHDGSYTIFLNARDSDKTQRYSFYHALDHIMRGDFCKHDVQEIEAEAHRRSVV